MSQYGHFPFFRAYLRPLPTPPYAPVIQVREALAKNVVKPGPDSRFLGEERCAIQGRDLSLGKLLM